MPTTPTGETASAIQEAIRAKRERKNTVSADIEALEASLLADIEAFDLDAAERLARREQVQPAFQKGPPLREKGQGAHR